MGAEEEAEVAVPLADLVSIDFGRRYSASPVESPVREKERCEST